MGEFNSDDHYIYYCGQESHRRNGVAIMVNKRVQNAVLGYKLKNGRVNSVHFQDKPFNITVIQVYDLTSNTEEGNGKSLEYSCLENPMNSMKRQNDRIVKRTPQVCRVPICYWRSMEK